MKDEKIDKYVTDIINYIFKNAPVDFGAKNFMAVFYKIIYKVIIYVSIGHLRGFYDDGFGKSALNEIEEKTIKNFDSCNEELKKMFSKECDEILKELKE